MTKPVTAVELSPVGESGDIYLTTRCLTPTCLNTSSSVIRVRCRCLLGGQNGDFMGFVDESCEENKQTGCVSVGTCVCE